MSELMVIEKLPFPVHLLELYQHIAEYTTKPLETLSFDLFQVLKAETQGLDKAIHELVLYEYFRELDENNITYSSSSVIKGLSFLVDHLRKELINRFSKECFQHLVSLHMESPTDVRIIFVYNQAKHSLYAMKRNNGWRHTLLT